MHSKDELLDLLKSAVNVLEDDDGNSEAEGLLIELDIDLDAIAEEMANLESGVYDLLQTDIEDAVQAIRDAHENAERLGRGLREAKEKVSHYLSTTSHPTR